MANFYAKIRLLLTRLLYKLPSKLPQGMVEFDTWAASIIKAYEMPNNDSIRFALAVQILHLPSTASHTAKAYFGKTLIKGAASQVAGTVMQDLKAKQAEALQAQSDTPQSSEDTAAKATPDVKP